MITEYEAIQIKSLAYQCMLAAMNYRADQTQLEQTKKAFEDYLKSITEQAQ